MALAVDPTDSLYIADEHSILRLTADGVLRRVAGSLAGTGVSGGDGSALNVRITPDSLACDTSGCYFSESVSHLARKLTIDGQIRTVAGRPQFEGDGGPAKSALFNRPSSLVTDNAGDLYIGDLDNYRIRKIVPSTNTVTTIAGSGNYSVEATTSGQQALAAGIYPKYLALDPQGRLLFADRNRIWRIGANGVVTHIAGKPMPPNFKPPDDPDGTAAVSAQMNIGGIGVDSQGIIYVSDYLHSWLLEHWHSMAKRIRTSVTSVGCAESNRTGSSRS